MNTIFFETNRLIVKKPALSDLNHLIALRSDPEVMQFVGNGLIQTKEDVAKFLGVAIAYQAQHGFSFGSVYEKASGEFVGQAGLFHLGFDDTQADIELAYRLHKKFWGKGYATELAEALIAWGFSHLDVKKLVALAWPDNMRSQRVLEKAGMIFKGVITFRDREVKYYEIYKNDLIELAAYNPHWPHMARVEIEQLRATLPCDHILEFQHVGSTAIPHIKAKPIIDIQIAVDSLSTIKPIAISALENLNYVYWYDNPDPQRMFFVKGMPPFGEKRTHHVHIYEPTSRHWSEKIKFRDYLIAHPEVAQEYEDLKLKLAAEYTHNREKYTQAKTEFINHVLARA